MRQGVVRVVGKGPPLSVDITETTAERRLGLEGHAPLLGTQGMLFPLQPPRAAEFHMAGVTFPIDLVFCRKGHVVRVVTGQPGQKGSWVVPQIDAVLEVQAGWCQKHGVHPGDQVVMGPESDRVSRRGACRQCGSCGGARLAYHEQSGSFGCAKCGWAERVAAQSADVLRTLTEAATEADAQDVAEENARVARRERGFARFSQLLVRVVSPGATPHINNVQAGRRIFGHLFDLLERRANEQELVRAWQRGAKQLDFWERDAVVHALVEAGHTRAVGLLKVAQAIPGPPPVGGDIAPVLRDGPPGAVRHTPPGDAWQDRQMPADTPGVSQQGAEPLFEQSFGYDPTHGEDLLDGRVEPMRPSASRKVAGGDVHPGDRVKIMDDVDGLEKDAGGVCLEVQGDSVKIKLDGEPVPRWILNDLCQQDQAKDDILKEMQEGDGGGGGGGDMAGLLGLLGGG